MTGIPRLLHDIVNSALADEAPCLVGTASRDGRPQISPKGSVVVYDENHLAFWERSGRSAIANIRANPRIVIYYRNPAKAKLLPQGAAVRFHGSAEVHEDGAERDRVWECIVPVERDKDPG